MIERKNENQKKEKKLLLFVTWPVFKNNAHKKVFMSLTLPLLELNTGIKLFTKKCQFFFSVKRMVG